MSEEIQAQHECKWANQHQAVSIISIKGHEAPWTLRVEMAKLIAVDPEDEDDQFNIDITFCPFCGQILSHP